MNYGFKTMTQKGKKLYDKDTPIDSKETKSYNINTQYFKVLLLNQSQYNDHPQCICDCEHH